MSIDRQKHQPIALADILVDQDRFDTDSKADARSLERLRIPGDMPDTRFMTAHHSNGLPSTCSAGTSSTVAYQDMTPFSTVSSFNFPATADATLLTPVSNAGSPPLHQRPSTKGAMRPYHQSQAAPNTQQPTPPNTSTGVYYPSYDLSSSSQSPSPLTVHPHATEYNMTPYMGQSPNHGHGHPSPKDDVPPPNNPYLGHYTVSVNCNDSEVSNFRDYPDFHNQVDPSFIARGPGGQMSHMQHIITTSAGTPPILTQPDPNHYRMQMTPRVEDLRDPNILTMGHPGQPAYQARVAATPRRNTRVKKVPSQQRRAASRPLAQQALRAMEVASQDNDSEAFGDGVEAVTLSDKCDDEARFIFETRRNLVRSGMKGKGMWEEISRKYEEVYGPRLEKATLQMRLTRAFAKHAIWPEREIEKLKEAFEYIEQKRHKLILDRMREIGGGQCWNWTAQLIEAKLIDLGFEEPNVDEKTNTRRRRRIARKRRAVAAQQSHLHSENWANGLGLHPAAAMQHPSLQHDSEEPEEMVPSYSTEQRDSYIDDVISKMKPEQDDTSPEPDAMDVSYHHGDEANGEPSQQQSTRVAKQAVEHLMLNGMRM